MIETIRAIRRRPHSHGGPSRRLPRDHAGAPQGKRHGPDLCVRWIAWVGLRIWGTGPTTTGRCASRRTRTARGSRSGWWADGAAPELAPAHARGRGDVSGSQVTGGTRLRTHGSRIAAAFFAASLVGAPAHAREPLFHPDWPVTEPGALLPRGDDGVRRGLFPNEAGRSFRGGWGERRPSPWASPRPAPSLSPGTLPRASSDARART